MQAKVRRISVERAREIPEKDSHTLLIDVRQPEKYAHGHILGAVLLPLPELPSGFFELKILRCTVA
ncbi:MAG: rhodanese-like domain-containing protein [Candidatus Caldatribacteriaceae bacterium]